MFFAEHIFFVIGSIKLPLRSGYDEKCTRQTKKGTLESFLLSYESDREKKCVAQKKSSKNR